MATSSVFCPVLETNYWAGTPQARMVSNLLTDESSSHRMGSTRDLDRSPTSEQTLQNQSRSRFSESSRSLANLRQFHLLAFYLFGACLADHFFATVNSIQRSRMALEAEGLESFGPLAWFAFIGFLALLFSHSVQWFASNRLNSVPFGTE
jgi:hypothetical protein